MKICPTNKDRVLFKKKSAAAARKWKQSLCCAALGKNDSFGPSEKEFIQSRIIKYT
jgi:hypothetical protein